METKQEVKIGDTISKPVHSVKTTFPWRAALLCLLRVGLCGLYWNIESSQRVVRTDGSTSSKRPSRRTRGHFRFEEVTRYEAVVSVILLDVFPDLLSIVLAGVSSLSLLVAILIDVFRKKPIAQKDKLADGDTEKDNRSASAAVLLAMFSLNLITTNIISRIPSALNNMEMIFQNVGQIEAFAYLAFFTSWNIVQFYCVMGGLNFLKCLLTEGTASETTRSLRCKVRQES